MNPLRWRGVITTAWGLIAPMIRLRRSCHPLGRSRAKQRRGLVGEVGAFDEVCLITIMALSRTVESGTIVRVGVHQYVLDVQRQPPVEVEVAPIGASQQFIEQGARRPIHQPQTSRISRLIRSTTLRTVTSRARAEMLSPKCVEYATMGR